MLINRLGYGYVMTHVLILILAVLGMWVVVVIGLISLQISSSTLSINQLIRVHDKKENESETDLSARA